MYDWIDDKEDVHDNSDQEEVIITQRDETWEEATERKDKDNKWLSE